MSFLSALTTLWSHRPTESSVAAAEAIFEAAKAFIAVLEDRLPDLEGKRDAIEAVNQAVIKSHVVLVHAAHKEASDASDAASVATGQSGEQVAP